MTLSSTRTALSRSAVIIVTVAVVTSMAFAGVPFTTFAMTGNASGMETTAADDAVHFENGFDNQSADSGVPDNWKEVTDPFGQGHSRNANVEEVTTDIAYEGDQAYYGEEGQGSNALYIQPNNQPLTNKTTEPISAALYKPTVNIDSSDAVDGPALQFSNGTGEAADMLGSIRVGRDGLEYRTSSPNDPFESVVIANVGIGEWVHVSIHDLDVQNDTFDIHWANRTASGEEEDVPMVNPTKNGYNNTFIQIDDAGGADSFSVGEQDTDGGTLSGRVTTQSGAPVSNATVQVLGVDHRQFNLPDAEEIETRANNLLQRAGNTTPGSFQPTLGENFQSFITENISGTYVAAHTESDWGIGHGVSDPDLGSPAVKLPAGQPVVFSVWDSTQSGDIIDVQDAAEEDLTGKIVDGEAVVVEQLAPGGGITSKSTIPPNGEWQSGGDNIIGDTFGSTHDFAKTTLQAGYYRVYPEGNPAASYLIQVGDSEDIFSGYASNLEDRAGSLTDRASWIRDQLSEGKFQQKTVSTGPNGTFSVTLGHGVKTVSVTAHKGPYDLMSKQPQNINLSDIRSLYQTTDLTRSVYLPASPQRVDVPASNVSVTMTEASAPNNLGLDRFQNISSLLDELVGNLSYSDLPAALQQRLDELDREQLEETYEELEDLRRQNGRLNERVDELLGDRDVDIDPGDASDEELQERIQALQQAMSELRNTIEAGDPTSSVDENTVSVSFPFQTDLSREQVMVLAHFSNGTTQTFGADSEYVSVESNTLGGDTVHINDYPLGDKNAKLANFEVRVANQDGLGQATEQVTNPGFSGDVPGLDAISFNTLRPGASDHVEMTLNPSSDTNYRNLTSATVYAPDGSTVPVTIEDANTLSFTSNGEGAHTIEAKFETTDGEEWTVTQRVAAGEGDVNLPPGIRVSETPYGVVAVTGDGLQGGSVDDAAGGTLTVTGQFAADQSIPTDPVNVYTAGANIPASTDITLRLVQGADDQSLSQRKRVAIHLPAMPQDVGGGLVPSLGGYQTFYRSGSAMPADGGSLGVVNATESETTIQTVTDSYGSVSVSTNSNAGVVEYAQWRASLLVQDVTSFNLPSYGVNLDMDLPVVGVVVTELPAGLVPELPPIPVLQVDVFVPLVTEPATNAVTPTAAAAPGGASA